MKKLLIGMEIEKYIGTVVEGFNCDFDYIDRELTRYRLIFRDSSLLVYESFGECYSGYTTASWGVWEWDTKRHPFSYRPKQGPVEVVIDESQDYDGNILVVKTIDGKVLAEVSDNGGDMYYPSGYAKVNEDFFVSTARTMTLRPVWIFLGASCLGKSTLAAATGKSVFETDSVDELPQVIYADIIVVGNKRRFKANTVKRHLPDGVKPILVNFST